RPARLRAGIGRATTALPRCYLPKVSRLPHPADPLRRSDHPQIPPTRLEIRPKLPAYPYFDYRFYKRLQSDSSTLFQIAGKWELILPLERGGAVDRVYPHAVTDNFFADLGVAPLLGRELQKGDEGEAVLSYSYWERGFGRDPRVVGQTVRLKGRPFQIVGVMPQRFTGTVVDSAPDLWIPYSNITQFSASQNPNLDNYGIEIIARVRRGVSRAQAEQETAALWTRYMEDDAIAHPANHQGRINGRLEARSISLGISPMRDQSGTALALLLAGTGLLMLMVCANIGGLMLARVAARERETAVRLAVGATRARIVREWLAESTLITLAGGAAGILVAYASAPLLIRWLPPVRGLGNDPAELRPWSLDLHPDLTVIAFSIGICALAAALSAIAPALRAARHDLSLALKTAISDRRHQRFQSVLCAIQVALCTVVLIFAGLMGRTLSKLRSLNPGFDSDRVAIFALDAHVRGYDGPQTWAFQQRLLEGARNLPGVDAAAIASRALMRGIGLGSSVVFPGRRGDGIINTSMNFVTPGYFETMGIRFLAGRELEEGDREEGQVTGVVVNQAFAHKFFEDQNPLGREFATGKEFLKPAFRIVGVVNDTKYRSLREIPPPIFYQYNLGPKQFPDTFILHVRTHGDPRAIMGPVRTLVQSIDPAMPLYQVATVAEEVDRSLWQERTLAVLGATFGVFGAALSGVGIYGILAHFVAGRRREIGLRMALGAPRARVIWLVSKRVAAPVCGGIIAGALIAAAAGTWVRSLLYGVEPIDPRSSGIMLILLFATAIAAAATPALRALRVDPASTLRQE
ncbi:MAG TPA: ADOP family duplicated permease, partial [Bryobacteraceae bacterium]